MRARTGRKIPHSRNVRLCNISTEARLSNIPVLSGCRLNPTLWGQQRGLLYGQGFHGIERVRVVRFRGFLHRHLDGQHIAVHAHHWRHHPMGAATIGFTVFIAAFSIYTLVLLRGLTSERTMLGIVTSYRRL